MPIIQHTSDGEIHDYVQKWLKNVIISIQEAMQMTLQEAVNKAKSVNTYKDQTNNLRSSIGYVLYYNGQEVAQAFAKSGTGQEGNGSEGVQRGKDLAGRAAKKYSRGFVGVLVAGENYAVFVESKGYDVITGSTLRFADDLQKYLDSVNKVFGTTFRRVQNG